VKSRFPENINTMPEDNFCPTIRIRASVKQS
jgi:hypothetical protein